MGSIINKRQTMTIYFNPRYDSSVFLTAADCGLRTEYAGSEALLQQLELRAGLTCGETDHATRVIAYIEAMEKALDAAGGSLFYAPSFERDDFGTAEIMLGWRDALVKAGWDGKPAGSSEKTDVLSQIEAFFDCPGTADRWKAILREAASRPILGPDDRIKVQGNKATLEPLFQKLFDAINSHYTVVEYEQRSNGSPEGLKCTILEFRNEYDAHEWIASRPLTDNDVVAEADTALLGDILHIMGKPGIGAADEGIGAIMRLLPLGLALFRYPADIGCLQSYLQSPQSPLGTLSVPLYNHICNKGGFGPGWNAIISKASASALPFIGMWDKSKALPEGQASKAEVQDYVKGLDKWAGRKIVTGGELNAQYMALQKNCGSILRLLGRWTAATVPVKTLSRWASHVCTPINISSDYARVGSVNVVDNVADIYSTAGNVIWFASTTDNDIPYEYGFLAPSEIDDLRNAGLLIPDKEQLAQWDRAYKLEGLARCSAVTIVTCARISGVETVKSALLAEISAAVASAPGTPVKKTVTDKVEKDLGKRPKHPFDKSIMDGFSREKESYSSIETLLMSPVDYLLQYVKGYHQYGIEGVADLPTTEGTVAHAYIEALGEACSKDPAAMLAMHKSSFDTLLDQVIDACGLALHLEGNCLEKNNFRVSLRESVNILLDIIIQNGLEIVDFEYPVTEDIAGIGDVFAKIDCLLQDPVDKKYVIFDFKYNYGSKYKKMLEENRELQLEIYRTVVKKKLGSDVKFIGYFVLPRKQLLTPDNTLQPNDAIVEIPRTDLDILKMAVKGYKYRMDQLRSGIAEEGEDLPLGTLRYFWEPDLYPLEANYDDKTKNMDEEDMRKARAYGDKNITLKGGLI